VSFRSTNRLGACIQTIYGNNNTPMEMGATWFGKEHKILLTFLSEINIGYFEQHRKELHF
jgi:monoamine oxidase